MRLFIAVDIPDELKPKIIHIQKQLAQVADVKLVEPENLHFTMKFLGEVDDENIQYLGEQSSPRSQGASILEDIEKPLNFELSKHTQFSVNIKGIGVFPNQNFIRVVWLGADSQQLVELQKSIDKSLSEKFTPEKNPMPHLTLARVRSFQKEIMEFVKSHEVIDVGTMKVSCVKLKQSILSRQGPTYEDLKVFELSS
jgi:2'-5' RNA ligase